MEDGTGSTNSPFKEAPKDEDIFKFLNEPIREAKEKQEQDRKAKVKIQRTTKKPPSAKQESKQIEIPKEEKKVLPSEDINPPKNLETETPKEKLQTDPVVEKTYKIRKN